MSVQKIIFFNISGLGNYIQKRLWEGYKNDFILP